MIIFENLNITSFKSIFKANLSFNELQSGLFSLEGKNNTVNFASSNGSGKTTVFDALAFVLYGTTAGLYLKKDEYQNKHTSIPLKIVLDFSTANVNSCDRYRIERTLTETKLYKNNEDISELTKSETESKLLKTLGISKEEFFNFTYLSQAGNNFLNKTASEKLAAIKDFVFGEELLQIKQKIDSVLKNTKDQLNITEKQLSNIEGTILGLQKLNVKKDSSIATLPSKEEIEQDKRHLAVLTKRQKDKRTIENNIASLCMEYESLKTKIINIKKQIEQAKNNICPLCKSPLTDKKVEQQLRLEANDIKIRAQEIKQDKQNLDAELEKFQDLDIQIQEQIQQISTKENIINNIEQRASIEKELQECKDSQQKIQEIVDNLKAKLLQITNLQKYFNTTFVQKVQQKFLSEIENYLNLYCYEMFNQTYSLRFDKSSLELFIGDYPYSYFSGGEKQRIDLLFVFAIKVALSNFTDKCTNLLIFDESLSGSDNLAFDNTIELIDKLSSTSSLITILVSHRECANISQNKILLERYENRTTLSITRS